MARKTMQDVYARFSALFADSTPIRGPREVDAAIRAATLDYDDVTDEWLRNLSHDWVVGRADEPFVDERTNRAYRRFIERMV